MKRIEVDGYISRGWHGPVSGDITGCLFRHYNESFLWEVIGRSDYTVKVRPVALKELVVLLDLDALRNIHYVWYEPENK